MGTRGDDREARRARPDRKELRRAVGEAIEGFRALERDVELDGRRAADVLGVDGDGRAWLAVLARDDRGAARALAALSLARGGARVLERLIRAGGDGAGELDLERAPGVVVAVAADDAVLVDLLRPLAALGARLVTVSRLAGRSGSALVVRRADEEDGAGREGFEVGRGGGHADARVDDTDRAPLTGPRQGLDAFLGALSPGEAGRAARLVQRLSRIDDELAHAVREGVLHVSIEDRALCSLTALDGRLAGAVASDRTPGEPLPLAGPADVERFVEGVVGRYLVVADRAGGEDEDDGLGPLPEFETTPPRQVQLLTREEIEAFHG